MPKECAMYRRRRACTFMECGGCTVPTFRRKGYRLGKCRRWWGKPPAATMTRRMYQHAWKFFAGVLVPLAEVNYIPPMMRTLVIWLGMKSRGEEERIRRFAEQGFWRLRW